MMSCWNGRMLECTLVPDFPLFYPCDSLRLSPLTSFSSPAHPSPHRPALEADFEKESATSYVYILREKDVKVKNMVHSLSGKICPHPRRKTRWCRANTVNVCIPQNGPSTIVFLFPFPSLLHLY
ncbi:hypothetical protein ABB37_10135, partial [Leptomonas pyrrhocoris]